MPANARLRRGRDSPGCISHSEQAGRSARLSPEIPFIRGRQIPLIYPEEICILNIPTPNVTQFDPLS